MKPTFTFKYTQVVALLLTLGVITIFSMAGTLLAHAQSTPIKQLAPTQFTQTKPPTASCGQVNARGSETPIVFNAQAAIKAEACFWRAYQQCQAKKLIFQQMGVDTGVNNTLWPIKQKGACRIADLVTHYSIGIPQGNYAFFFTCSKLQKTRQGLLISKCGQNADLLVPTPTSTP